MSEPNERDKEVADKIERAVLGKQRPEDGIYTFDEILAAYREEIEAGIEKKIVDSEKWEREWAENCGGMALPAPAPAQSRDEEQLRSLLRAIRHQYSSGVWGWTEDQCLAALRTRQSPQAAAPELDVYNEVYSLLADMKPRFEDVERVQAELFERFTIQRKATPPQPSPQIDDLLLQEIFSLREKLKIAVEAIKSSEPDFDAQLFMHRLGSVDYEQLMEELGTEPSPQGEDAIQREINGCSMDVINYVNALRARLAATADAGREMRDFVAKVAEPGPRTGEDARDWQREAGFLLADAALERKEPNDA